MTFFVCTGRSGTQWLTHSLRAGYSDIAEIAHEPIGPAYRPREFLRAYDRAREMSETREIAVHLDRVEEVARSRPYVEVGWPAHSAVPLLVERFGTALRLVHLIRDPVRVAMSLATHNFYAPDKRADDYVRHAQLDPWAPGASLESYKARWHSLTPYEKCLFWWTEIHLYGVELRQRYPDMQIHRTRFEDLVNPNGVALRGLREFLSLPFRSSPARPHEHLVDRHRQVLDDIPDWRLVWGHPDTVALASSFGYEVSQTDEAALVARYSG